MSWKTSSSSDFSLKYKLEEAKLFLREMLNSRPELLEEFSMNGDYTKEGKELLHSYYDIIHMCGYKHIQRFIPENNTFDLLKENYNKLSRSEIMNLEEIRQIIRSDY